MSIAVLDDDTKIVTNPVGTDEGDHDRFSHYTDKKALGEALFNGTSCVALCGKRWVPTRDPNRYPVCPECKDVFENVLTDD